MSVPDKLTPEVRALVSRRIEKAKRITNDGSNPRALIARATKAGVGDHAITCRCPACEKFWG
ncbi:MAG: hypothetical protein JW880_05180 [Candidatus Thermoplasmatota archaeon]|nr:hypothetical protein [Candidatus Thermoplasmatota archaeon]